jgi:hypothetical protein
MAQPKVNYLAKVRNYKGPFANVFACPCCKRVEIVYKGRGGGSFWGKASKARSAIVAHMKAEHTPEEVLKF